MNKTKMKTSILSVETAITRINKLRRFNVGRWYYFEGNVEGKQVAIKGYGTWLQVFKVEGADVSNTPDGKVSEFLTHLKVELSKN